MLDSLTPKDILLKNFDKIHTTPLGRERISKNLKLKDKDAVSYCKNIIKNDESKVFKNGKNFYCEKDKIKITVNSSNYCIITAHLIK